MSGREKTTHIDQLIKDLSQRSERPFTEEPLRSERFKYLVKEIRREAYGRKLKKRWTLSGVRRRESCALLELKGSFGHHCRASSALEATNAKYGKIKDYASGLFKSARRAAQIIKLRASS